MPTVTAPAVGPRAVRTPVLRGEMEDPLKGKALNYAVRAAQ
ncbi:hypothetical protein ACIPJS_19210 [Streptomyces sp. NPDC086783]